MDIPRKNLAMCVDFLNEGDFIKLSKQDLYFVKPNFVFVSKYASETTSLPDAVLYFRDGKYLLEISPYTKLRMVKSVDTNSFTQVEFIGFKDSMEINDLMK